jgi:hypothetical protein
MLAASGTAIAPPAASKDFGSPSLVGRSADHDRSPPAPPCRVSNMPCSGSPLAPLRSWASVVAHSGDPVPGHSAAIPGESTGGFCGGFAYVAASPCNPG